MAEFEPVLTKNVGVPDVQRLEVYRSRGGYQAAEKALRQLSPDEIVNVVVDSRLRGRGGAGFPCGVKWRFLPPGRTECYMCVNADESEPGTFCNRVILEGDPHQLIEGIIVACYATGVARAYIYLRYEYVQAYHTLQRAIDEAYAAGYLGRNILGTDFSLDVYIHRGAAAYVCGEETGRIESIEGKRGWPRAKPPFPATCGAFYKPTVVNNVETICCVKHIVERGADWFKSIGVPADPENPRDLGSYGPKMYCLSGHVNRPGCYELPLGVTCNELIYEYGGGIWHGRRAKAAVPGGISTGFLRVDEFDVRLDFNSVAQAGCLGLGTGGVVVIDETASMIDVTYNCCRFFAHESCGQCTPCRKGTPRMLRILERIRAGRGGAEDIDLLLEIADSLGLIPGTTICGLADGAAWSVKSAIRKFREEFEAAVRTGRAAAATA